MYNMISRCSKCGSISTSLDIKTNKVTCLSCKEIDSNNKVPFNEVVDEFNNKVEKHVEKIKGKRKKEDFDEY